MRPKIYGKVNKNAAEKISSQYANFKTNCKLDMVKVNFAKN